MLQKYSYQNKKRAQYIEQLKKICDILFTHYFELNYTINKVEVVTSYQINLHNFIANGIYYKNI